MKKIMSMFVALTILVAPAISFADNTISLDGDPVAIEFNIRDIENAKKISFEEAVEKRMIFENISYEESLERMIKEEEEILQNFAEKLYEENYSKSISLADNKEVINEIKNNINVRNIINYVSIEHPFTYEHNSYYKGQLEAELRIVQDTSKSYLIDKVTGLNGRRTAGTYAGEWVGTASDYDLAVGRKSVYMWIKGYFETQVDGGVSGGITIPGFNFDVNIGGTSYYKSKTIKVDKTYSVR